MRDISRVSADAGGRYRSAGRAALATEGVPAIKRRVGRIECHGWVAPHRSLIMPIDSQLLRSFAVMNVPDRQPVVTMLNLATAFRRDRSPSPSPSPSRRSPAESARQVLSLSVYGSSLHPSSGGNYFSRSVELPAETVADRPNLRRSPRASFDENSTQPSSRLHVADVIPHTCGRRRSSAMIHRSSPVRLRPDSAELDVAHERPRSQQRFSPSVSPRRSPVPPSTASNDASWSNRQYDVRYDRQTSIHQKVYEKVAAADGRGARSKVVRHQSSNVEWESPRERSPPVSFDRDHERSLELSNDMHRRLSIRLGSRAWKSDESPQPPISSKSSAVENPHPTLVRHQSTAGYVVAPSPQQRRDGAPRTVTRAMTIEAPTETCFSSSSPSDRKPNSLTSAPVLFDPLTARTLTLKSLLPREKKALRMTFSVMNNNMFVKLMEQILRRLETACPEIRSLFFTTAFINSFTKTPEQQENHCHIKTIHDHAKIMAQMFDDVIKNLDTYDIMVPYLRQYGRKHALMRSSGFKVDVIEKFGELAVDYIGKQDCIKNNHIAVGAWRLLIACITDEMRFGFERECRKNERQNSFSELADVDSFRAT